MKFAVKTEYGLICLVYMARYGSLHPVKVKDIVEVENFSMTFTEKILQKLRTAHIVESHQGHGGGYVLAKHPSQITFKEIVECMEGETFEVFCEPEKREEIVCNHITLCGVKPIWRKTKELLDNYYSQITLEMLANNSLEKTKNTAS